MVRSILTAGMVAALAALLAACNTATPPRPAGASPAAAPAEPVVLQDTPHARTVTVILPQGEPSSRARSLARAGCPGDTRAALIQADGNRFVFRCADVSLRARGSL